MSIEDKIYEYHQPVMVNEVINNLITSDDGIYVDCTFGGGGHSLNILKKLNKNAKLIAFDQDKDTIKNINLINDKRLQFINSNFKYISNFLKYNNIDSVDGIFADLGVSSHQIDTPERGFSNRFNGKLDMRMKQNISKNALSIINKYNKNELIYIFKNYGELYNAEKIADIITHYRILKQIETTDDLKNVILKNINTKKLNINKFLAQIFQAIRIEVNDELTSLKLLLEKSSSLLKKNGRIVILSYHSLEDRIVKTFLKTSATIKSLYKKPLTPTADEIKTNPRSRSAKLRIGIKIN